MLQRLRELEQKGSPIRVGLVGAGSMGVGIAWQVGQTPGMELAFVADQSIEAANNAALACKQPANKLIIYNDAWALLNNEQIEFDVLVESTNSIASAAGYCRAAIARKKHIVLMNAEVDLAFGELLQHEANMHGVVVSSDGGDQHGVLKRMIDEIEMWGFRITQAGNIKGFLDRHATAQNLLEEAAKRHLNPIQCCAYTDGTKLNIEMALLANGLNLLPAVRGMQGPACENVNDVFDLFDFDAYGTQGRVDYILGAEPGGGVYVVAHCDDPLQAQYLQYYKLGDGPYYLFYRPYHLCHLETPRVIAEACLDQTALLQPKYGRLTDVYAFAKRDLAAGSIVDHAIGGASCYGLIDTCTNARLQNLVPIVMLENEGDENVLVTRALEKDQPITWDDVEIPDSYLMQCWHEQQALVV